MSRSILALAPDQLTACDLDAFIAHAHVLNQHNRITFTTPLPKASSRWLSHYACTPQPIACTSQGDVDGGLSWLVGVTLDCSFTRSLCAPSYGSRGGSCDDPASLVVLAVVAKVDQYVDDAQCCRDLHDSDKGRRYRQLAGLHGTVPGEDDLRNFRSRIGDAVIDQITAVAVDFLRCCGLIKGALLSTDGQLEPSYARYKGCMDACQACQAFERSEADRQALGEQWQSGAKRLQLTCPFPEAVEKVRQGTAKTGTPKPPKWPYSRSRTWPTDRPRARTAIRSPRCSGLAKMRCQLCASQVPAMRLTGCHLSRDPQGELLGRCPKVPSDLEAKVGYHLDTKDSSQKELIFGYLHQKTTDINRELGLELPVGNSTFPADTNEGSHFLDHRAALAVPVLPGQVQLGDAAYNVTANYQWLGERGGIAVFASNPRNEHLDPASLVNRGYDAYGTPYAPCGRLCRSNGYDYQAQSRQYVCGRQCPPRSSSTAHTALASWAIAVA